MNPAINNLSALQLRRAAAIKERIEALQAELDQLLGALPEPGGNGSAKKRHLSPAAIARIRAGQKARWAKFREENPSAAPAKGTKRRHMSPTARARLAEIARARWKAVKAKGKSAL
jgi:hypothetical protein